MYFEVWGRLGRDLVAVLGRLGRSRDVLSPLSGLMKNSRGRWAQLGGLPGGGRLVVQGGQRLREHGSGVVNPFIGGLYKVNKTSLP